jgi:hypothetical protein
MVRAKGCEFTSIPNDEEAIVISCGALGGDNAGIRHVARDPIFL